MILIISEVTMKKRNIRSILWLMVFILFSGGSAFSELIDNGDGLISDTVTGLIWEQTPDGSPVSYSGAAEYCRNLNIGNQSDFRVPRIDELAQIADYSRNDPALSPAFSVREGSFWSETLSAGNSSEAWILDYFDGSIKTSSVNELIKVRCVAGNSKYDLSPASRLTDDISGEVTVDAYTELQWQKNPIKTVQSFENAKTYCSSLETGGYSDWRLPSVHELVKIINYTSVNPAINTQFIDATVGAYWSSTEYADSSNKAWFADMKDGSVSATDLTGQGFALCVRGMPENGPDAAETLKVSIVTDKTIGPAPLQVRFSAAVSGHTGPYTYEWDFGGEAQSTTQSPSYTFSTAGAYTVIVTVTDAEGDSASGSVDIIASDANAACSLASDLITGNVPLSVNLTITLPPVSGSVTSTVWDYGDGESERTLLPVSSKSHTYATAGVYTASYTQVGSPTFSCDTKITVKSNLAAAISISPDNGYAPLTVAITGSATGGQGPYTYSVDFGDGDSATGESQTHVYDTPGVYIASVTATDANGMKYSASGSLTVTEEPPPLSCNINVEPTSPDTPLDIKFSADLPNVSGSITQIIWNYGDGESGNSLLPLPETSHTYAAAGEYTVSFSQVGTPDIYCETTFEAPLISYVSIQMSPTEAVLSQKGDSLRFLIEAYDTSGNLTEPKNITFKSSDTNVVKIDGKSAVAVGDGTATVTASIGNLTAEAVITVSIKPVSLEVRPNLIFLEKDEGTKPYVTAIYLDGHQENITDFIINVVSGGDYVSVKGTSVVGKANGIARLSCEYEGLSTELLVQVTVPPPLNISPSIVKVKAGEAVAVTVDGGKPPYSVTVGSIKTDTEASGKNKWELTAPTASGDTTYVVTDSAGGSATLTITVLAPLKLTADVGNSPAVDPGTEIHFATSGGNPPYRWYATAGEISEPDSDNNVTYTAPLAVGIYTVTVEDAGGQTYDFVISTIQSMIVTPAKLNMSPGGTRKFRVTGGQKPYTATADAGAPVADGEGGFDYTAPEVVGNYLITVRDNRNSIQTIKVVVVRPLLVSPSSAYLDKEEEKIFKLAGGFGKDADITVQALKGDVPAHPEKRSFTYKAPTVTGPDTILVTDINGQQTKVEIEVTSDLFFVSPSNEALLPGEERYFRAVAGVGDEFSWVSSKGDIDNSYQGKRNIAYVAAEVLGVDKITATDKSGNTADANIHVVSDYVLITPKEVFLTPGSSATFRALRGSGDYEFTVSGGDFTVGDSNADGENDELVYKAPARVGNYFVTVFDSSGNSAQAIVYVSGGTVKPKPPELIFKEVANPLTWPSASQQPMGAGKIQEGGDLLDLAVDFPNYTDEKGDPVAMNYYLGVFVEPLGMLVLFNEEGGLSVGEIVPFMSGETSAFYQKVFSLDFCQPDPIVPIGNYHIYGVAVESGYDPDKNFSFNPPDAPFEIWHFTFDFKGCS